MGVPLLTVATALERLRYVIVGVTPAAHGAYVCYTVNGINNDDPTVLKVFDPCIGCRSGHGVQRLPVAFVAR